MDLIKQNTKVDLYATMPILYAFIFSVFLLPPLEIVSSIPKIHVTDILVFPAVLLIFRKFTFSVNELSKFLFFWVALALVVVLSILVNGRMSVMNDYFELFKIFKFAVFLIFLAIHINLINISFTIKVVFVCLLLFNLLHYFNVANFNQNILPYYSAEIHCQLFGKNSAGGEATKRLIGTSGNPNNNAILFLFFVIFFAPNSKSKLLDKIFFLIAGLAVLACQSRTGFVAFIPVFFIAMYANKVSLKWIALYLMFFVSVYFALTYTGNTYLTVMGKSAVKTNSVQGRIHIWEQLWEMIKEKPILGHAPFKEYFYSNKLYPESEYMLMTWRYGFTGLLFFLGALALSIKQTFSVFKANRMALCFLLCNLVFVIASITNTPFSNINLIMIYVLMASFFYSSYKANKVNAA